MYLRRNLRLSISALAGQRWRTLLSASSMSIAVAAVVVLFGAGGGAERAFSEALEAMGKNLLSVTAERTENSALRGAGRQVETLTLADWRAITATFGPASRQPTIARAAPIAMRQLDLRHGKKTLSATVIGTTPEFQFTNNQRLAAGRFFDHGDIEGAAPVAVIGAHVVRELFAGEQPLGERLLVTGVPLIVIGTLREKGTDPTGADEDNRILIPVLTAQRRLLDVDYLDRIFVQAVAPKGNERKARRDTLRRAEEQVRALLRERHGIDQATEDDFTIRTQAALLKTLEGTDRSFSRLIVGLVVLTLGLASTGLLAISLLSVKERHAEIGLRLAVGARPHHVLCQFLAETAIVATLGAFGGLLAGGTSIILGKRLIGWRLALTWEAVAYPFLISLAIAVVFGAYPALRAARLDPIVALRSQ